MEDKTKPIIVKTSEIKIRVGLNAENTPSKMEWMAEDNPGGAQWSETKAMFLALFDKENKDTLKIDIWTQEMQVLEMDRMVYQTIRALADTYFKATQNTELANQMQQFAQFFGEQVEIIPKVK
jgi:gliding motility-associated protein GldC